MGGLGGRGLGAAVRGVAQPGQGRFDVVGCFGWALGVAGAFQGPGVLGGEVFVDFGEVGREEGRVYLEFLWSGRGWGGGGGGLGGCCGLGSASGVGICG